MKNQGKNINLEADIKDLSAIELEAIVGGRQTSINTDSITYTDLSDEQYKPNPIPLPYPKIPINEPGLPPKHAK